MPTYQYQFSPSVDGASYVGNYGDADKISVIVTDNGIDNVYANNVILSGSYALMPSGTPDGNDSLLISASVKTKGLATSAELNYNELAGGNGNNKLSLVANGNALTGILGNTLSATDGKDNFSIAAKTKGGLGLVEDGFIRKNSLSAGDGVNKFSLKADTTGDDAAIIDNTLEGGADKDSVSMSAKTGGKDGDPGGADATVNENEIDLRQGKNQIKIDAQSAGDDAAIDGNTISAGDDGNKITLTAKTAGKESNTDGEIYANADAYVSRNSIVTGDGKDSLKITAQTSNDDAVASYNRVFTEDGADSVTISLKTSGKGTVVDTYGTSASIFLVENEINLGDENDKLKITGQTSGDNVLAFENFFYGGEGDDTLQVILKTAGKSPDSLGANAYFTYNTLEGASGADKIQVTLQTSGDTAFADGNEFFDLNFSDKSDVLDILVKSAGKSGGADAIFQNNLISHRTTGSIDLSVKVETGGDNALIYNNDFDIENGTADLLVKTNGKLGDAFGADAYFFGNSVGSSSEGVIQADIDVQSGGDDVFFSSNELLASTEGSVNFTTYAFEGPSSEFSISARTTGKTPDANGGDAYANSNTLETAENAKFEFDIESKDDDAFFNSNLIQNTTSDHYYGFTLDVSVKSTGKSELDSPVAGISLNTLDSNHGYSSGVGDRLTFTAESKNGDARFSSNMIDTGTANGYGFDTKSLDDELQISVKSSGKGGDDKAIFSSNFIEMGTGKDMIEIDLSARNEILFVDNMLDTGGDGDRLEIDLSSKGGVIFTNNQFIFDEGSFYGGGGLDEVILKIKAGDGVGSDLSGNSFYGAISSATYGGSSAANFTLDIDTGGDQATADFLDNNSISGSYSDFKLTIVQRDQYLDEAVIGDNLSGINHLELSQGSTLRLDEVSGVADISDYNYTSNTYNLFVSGNRSSVDLDEVEWSPGAAVTYQGYQATLFTSGNNNLYVANGVNVV